MSQAGLPFGSDKPAAPKKQFEKPPNLKRIVSISTGLLAKDFFRLLKEQGVSLVMDTRRSPKYRGFGFATIPEDFIYNCDLHGVGYMAAEAFMPSKEMRDDLSDTFKMVKSSHDRDPTAWTRFLTSYETLMRERRPFRNPDIRNALYGEHEAIAVVCACPRHDDCHRSYTTALLTHYLPDVELVEAYPGNQPPKFASPRRYRLQDFPDVGLLKNATPHAVRQALAWEQRQRSQQGKQRQQVDVRREKS